MNLIKNQELDIKTSQNVSLTKLMTAMFHWIENLPQVLRLYVNAQGSEHPKML
jgi:hypothetical protein